MKGSVGIIANPASGKDIRRLVAHGSIFDNNEKINIIQRVLLGLDALGIERVMAMPDISALARQAGDKAKVSLAVELLDIARLGILGKFFHRGNDCRHSECCILSSGADRGW